MGDKNPISETTVTDNNTTTVPKPVRNREKISSGDTLGWFIEEGEWIVIKTDGAGGDQE
ncbi:hypothetical protein [Salinibaculum salinum]|uniref:hypothetical protein n=1 Tax=Salinibaculum salinum TaxID=3131996 RepID=UPI0030EC36F9